MSQTPNDDIHRINPDGLVHSFRRLDIFVIGLVLAIILHTVVLGTSYVINLDTGPDEKIAADAETEDGTPETPPTDQKADGKSADDEADESGETEVDGEKADPEEMPGLDDVGIDLDGTDID